VFAGGKMILVKTHIGCITDFWSTEDLIELIQLAIQDLEFLPNEIIQKGIEMYETAIELHKL